ncbi:MAG: tetratricopeptide repeat protein [candidate division Zixibacteria bacterium]|nr:tetratricopeptide repeat protein [candidate division Zixibacteria bacterium]
MSEINRCPKCKEVTLFNTSHRYIRGEFIRFTGKCFNCGHEISTEDILDELNIKFNLKQDFEHLQEPLESILAQCKATDEELRKQILGLFVDIYGEKAQEAVEGEEFENSFNRFLNYKKALEGSLTDGDIYLTKGLYRFNRNNQEGFKYLEEAFTKSEGSAKRNISLILWVFYERAGEFDKALEFLDLNNQLREKFPFIPKPLEECEHNDYLVNRGELLFKNGAYQEALELLSKVSYTREMVDALQSKEKKAGVEVESLLQKKNLRARKIAFSAAFMIQERDKTEDIFSQINEIDPLKLGIEYPFSDKTEYVHYFLCLMSYLSEKDKAKAYEFIKEADVIEGYEHLDKDDPEYFINEEFKIYLSFLKGKVFLEYALSSSCKDCRQLLLEAKDYFEESIGTARRMPNFDNPEGIELDGLPPIYEGPIEDWVSFPDLGKFEIIIPKAHKYIGEIYEKLEDKVNAVYEYKLAEELNKKFGNSADCELEKKISTFSKAFFNKNIKDLQIEVENLPKITAKEIPFETTKRIIFKLDGIKDSFPKHYVRIKKLVEKIGDEMPDILLNPLRTIAHEYLKKIYKGENKDSSFSAKVKELWDQGKINNYVRSLLLLIWNVGKEGSHADEYPYIEELKLEDIEVVISAEVRFLNWYAEKYSKQK